MTTTEIQGAAEGQRSNRFYVTAWRWHFYAGLYVISFLLMRATTGLIMLWISALSEVNGDLATAACRSAILATG